MGATGEGQQEYFLPAVSQKHLLILRIHAVAQYVVTKNCPDGWIRKPGKDPFPNNALQVSVADLDWANPDGTKGKIFAEAMIHTGGLIRDLKKEVGRTKLLVWRQAEEPKDPYGNPQQSNPYAITDMSGNDLATQAASAFLAAHPEFMNLAAPAPYEARQAPPPPPPAPVAPQQQGWASPQQYPPAQQGYPPQQPQWTPPPQPQWQQPPAPQQQPSPWNTAAPPPGYQQLASPPPQQPGSFFDAAQQVPPSQYPQGPAYNHHGQPQPQEPPY